MYDYRRKLSFKSNINVSPNSINIKNISKMTIIIYFTEDKKNYQIIRPQTEGENKFKGDVSKLVEHLTKSYTTHDGQRIRNYHSYVVL